MQGESVRILCTWNVQGFSPSYLVVDDDGFSAWVPTSEIRIVNPNFLPLRAFTSKNR